MEIKAPSARARDIERQVNQILRPIDLLKRSRDIRETIANLRQNLHDARIYTTDYELSETRENQLDNAKQAKRYLERANKGILTASEDDIFGTLDVAHITALIDQLKADLK
jgi:hypothetical protein